jgi:dTDP-4-amino-4,6-dideoxygalactose transaminase
MLNNLLYYRGRVAQAAILKALDIGQGDKVAIQAFSCLAVPESVYATGAEPLYVDIEPNGYNMCPNSLSTRITKDTKAIILQHTFGIPANIDEIMAISADSSIPIIEDCCHTLQGKYKSQLLGTFGIAAFYSFEWGKPIAVGLGGSASINDLDLKTKILEDYCDFSYPNLIKQLKIELQYHAFKLLYRPNWYWPVRSAFHWLSRLGAAEGNFNELEDITNGNVEDFSKKMAWLVVHRFNKKYSSLDKISAHSLQVAKFYQTEIKTDAVIHPIIPKDSDVIFARYPLRVKQKNEFLKYAKKENIEFADWYATPIHPLTLAQASAIGYEPGSCPNAELRSSEIISLPTHKRVSEQFLEKVRTFFGKLDYGKN